MQIVSGDKGFNAGMFLLMLSFFI